MVRTRIAPSPTGYPHIGTIYQALFNYAYAKKHDGRFIVRIEDTDRVRLVEGSEDVIFQSLDWFGLPEDESARKEGDVGPYRQSERLHIYHKYAQELIDNGHAYFAYYPKEGAGQKKDYSHSASFGNAQDKSSGQAHSSVPQQSSEQVENPPRTIAEMIERGDWIVRMKVPQGEKIVVHDEIRGDITFESDQVTEQVLIKSDGFPTYHLAVVVDDHFMQISHIVRAEEWLSSLPKHVLLYRYFGWDMPPVFHTVTLRNPDKSKLSKRHGHTNVLWFKEEGYLPEAVLNFLALLGWSHPEEKEMFSLEEFVALFDLKDIRSAAPIFDLTKLTWMNQQYIQKLSDEALATRLKDFYPDLQDDELLEKLLPLLKTRMNTLKDFATLTHHFFESPAGTVKTQQEITVAKDLRDHFSQLQEWNKDQIFQACRTVMNAHHIRMPMLYTILTGKERGLPLPESLEILGKEETLRRLI